MNWDWILWGVLILLGLFAIFILLVLTESQRFYDFIDDLIDWIRGFKKTRRPSCSPCSHNDLYGNNSARVHSGNKPVASSNAVQSKQPIAAAPIVIVQEQNQAKELNDEKNKDDKSQYAPKADETTTMVKGTAPKQPQPKQPAPSKKFYFPLNHEDIFLKRSDTCGDCIFEAEETSAGLCRFTLVSISKAKAWDLSGAVVNVGKVLQEQASGFKTITPGIAERKEDNGTVYWKITSPVKVEYIK